MPPLSVDESQSKECHEGQIAEPDAYLAGYLAGLAAANARENLEVIEPTNLIEGPSNVHAGFQPSPFSAPIRWPNAIHAPDGTLIPQARNLSPPQPLLEWPAAHSGIRSMFTGVNAHNGMEHSNGATTTAHRLEPVRDISCQRIDVEALAPTMPISSTTACDLVWDQLHLYPSTDLASRVPTTSGCQLYAIGNQTLHEPDMDYQNNSDQLQCAIGARIVSPADDNALTDITYAPTIAQNQVEQFETVVLDKVKESYLNSHVKTASRPGRLMSKRFGKPATQPVFRVFGSTRSKFDEPSRIRTAMTRKLGACSACRAKKLRCEQSAREKFVPCDRCAKQPSHLLPAPCCRIELVDIKLFRLGSAAKPDILQQWILSKQTSQGRLLLDNETIAIEPARCVHLTHDITRSSFSVTLSRFQPGPDDTTAYIWTDQKGRKRQYQLPPYYISDMAEAGVNMRQYILKARGEILTALLANSNPIVRKTFLEAERYSKTAKSDLVATALMFWSATRMIERFWLICGQDLLDIPPMRENIGPCRRNHFVDSVPVTPIMDTQLDELAVSQILIPLKTKLLRLLQKKILKRKKEDWYEIYLASFVVLHNFERILDHFVHYGRRFGVGAEAPKSNDETPLSHAYYHACKTILAYFHFMTGGAAPLSLDWLSKTQDASAMSEAQMRYLRDMQSELRRQDAELQTLKQASMYGTELYWCYQMLVAGWKADMPHQGRMLELTEKDFLVS